MKRLGCYPQGKPRHTSLADIVFGVNGWGMPTETVRKLLVAHHGTWSEPMTLEESIAFDQKILAEALGKAAGR